MIALGCWQLQRRGDKEAVLAVARTNLTAPATIFPRSGPVPVQVLYRPSSLICLRVAGWDVQAGGAADGSSGFRYIARCVTGAEGPGALVALGVGNRPDLKPAWRGGRVAGWISEEPDHRSLWSRMTGPATVLRPMLIAQQAPVGLKQIAPPRVEDVPNNHLAYAVQWFLFAGIAAVIFLIAVRCRTRDS
jgi:cytochrome oxidase assembly protein ShyY1